MGEMEINAGGGAAGSNETAPDKPVQNENIKPEEPSKVEAPSNAKKFFNTNNETSQPVQNTSKIVSKVAASAAAAASQPGMFNGLKIFGIGDLNPYQNK
jgi:hypothetical protein